MKSKLLRVAHALVLGLTALALASPALAHDPYCARPSDHQVVYDNGYGSYAYDNGDYGSPYGDDQQYTQYGYARQPYSHDGYGQQGYSHHGYQRRYSPDYRYGQQGYSQDGYQRPYSSDYGNGYRGDERGYSEDHVRTTFNPFPLPHFDKRIIRHYHPY